MKIKEEIMYWENMKWERAKKRESKIKIKIITQNMQVLKTNL